MKHENENPYSPVGGNSNPKGVFISPPSREYANSKSRTDAAKRTLSLLKKRVRFTPEVETPKDELRRCEDGNIRGTLNGIETEIFQGESKRPGAIPGIKYDFVRFKNHPAFDEYGNYIGKNKIIGE